MRKKSQFIKNTAILFAAMFITKIIGAFLKIPLTNLIGGKGMGYFSAAYSFFTPVYTVLAAGLPTIVTKLTAQCIACKKYREAHSVKASAIALSVAGGIAGTAFMFALAVPFVNYAAASPESLYSVYAIAPSILFCCMASAYRGYYEGLYNMLPTAVSQVLESVVKAIMGLGLSQLVLSLGEKGILPQEQVLPYAAAAAVLGVTLGEFCGTLFLVIRSRLKKDLITDEMLKTAPPPQSGRKIAKEIFLQSLPISIGALIINLGSFIDLLTISGGIQESLANSYGYFLSNYPEALKEAGAGSFGSFVYGSYTGIVLSVFMLISSLTALIGKSSLPAIAAEYECGSREEVKRSISVLLSGIFVVGLPLCLSLGALSEPVLKLLYPVCGAEVSVSAVPLSVLCFGGITVAVCGGLFSVFQAIGRSDLPIKLMMPGSGLKLILNFIFLRIPQISLFGAALSTVISHLLVMIMGLVLLDKAAGIKINIFPLFVKPLAASSACCLFGVVCYYLLFDGFNSVIRMILTALGGALVYAVLMLLLDRRILFSVMRYKKT
ncbi:MAG: polysaccharide biosynthesis C-terminal domain-containing protein [Firmicutes bacterium]|nr:polysaccharide biosynthesis C-terminal domain-containing protein [[Eubacterium] siraeum]MCM1488097.1 polysaccharide biosynthesis C-terminal domain-containing protein [Bacillota bacterium]